MEENENKAFVVEDNDGILISVFRLEGSARRFCKDRGYSYTEFHADVVSNYWKERCRLVEDIFRNTPISDIDVHRKKMQDEKIKMYSDFITNSKEPK